jgi:retron-type reverse transcriptase
MCDNLLKNMDSGQINCIVFLDVRKAFDSINHEILIDKMRNFFGVTGNQLRWYELYLNNMQSSTMSYKRTIIEPKKIICGVPQGSILGPILFLLYINDMPDSLSHLTPSLYADDKEIYASSNDCADLVDKVNIDLENIGKWMLQNKLQIHPSKSKHMFIGSPYNLKNKVSGNPILINNKLQSLSKVVGTHAVLRRKSIYTVCYT